MQRTGENDAWKDFLTLVVVVGLIWAAFAIGSCSPGQQSAEGMGGDPNPTEQYADPCGPLEGACDPGNLRSTDTVPDRNGELPDR